jgi:hypothetical protein
VKNFSAGVIVEVELAPEPAFLFGKIAPTPLRFPPVQTGGIS